MPVFATDPWFQELIERINGSEEYAKAVARFAISRPTWP